MFCQVYFLQHLFIEPVFLCLHERQALLFMALLFMIRIDLSIYRSLAPTASIRRSKLANRIVLSSFCCNEMLVKQRFNTQNGVLVFAHFFFELA